MTNSNQKFNFLVHVLFVAIKSQVSITVYFPVKVAKDFSNGLCKTKRIMSVYEVRNAQYRYQQGRSVLPVDSTNVSKQE